MDLLRFSTAGSVDDGKSTLIGRLLYDSKGVFEDQLEAVARSTVNRASVGIDLSLLTDGLRAEREQGITIDVAYRYFATPKRKFIIADTPGHEQYTRNMATGASTANLSIVLIDARHGALVQSRRHTFIAALLGIPHLVVAVNKMDLVDWSQARFDEIVQDFKQFTDKLGARDVTFIPLSALLGDNVVERSANMPWYQGPTLLQHLEDVDVGADENHEQLRFPVQLVIRPNLDFRGFAGQITAGVVRVGDEVVALPAGTRSRVKQIHTLGGDLQEAFAPQSVTILLDDEIDISRGDMLVHPGQLPWVRREFLADIVWMDGTPLDLTRPYLVKHTARTVRGRVAQLQHRVDVNTLAEHADSTLRLNEIGRVRLAVAQPLFIDAYAEIRRTGCFVLIDPLTHATVAAGMIARDQPSDSELLADQPRVDRSARQEQTGHKAAVLIVQGGEAADRAAFARQLESRLFQRGSQVIVIDQASAGPTIGDAPQADQRAGALLQLLVQTGHLVVLVPWAQLDARSTLQHLQAADVLVMQLSENQTESVNALRLGDVPGGGQAQAERALVWLTDRGVFGTPSLLTPGAGI